MAAEIETCEWKDNFYHFLLLRAKLILTFSNVLKKGEKFFLSMHNQFLEIKNLIIQRDINSLDPESASHREINFQISFLYKLFQEILINQKKL